MINPLLLSALLLAQAAPAEQPCITPQEAGDMAVALLPSMVEAVATRCRPHLAAEAFLLTGANPWIERLRRDGASRRASALRGIGLISGGAAPPSEANEATFDFVAQMFAGVLTRELKAEYCGDIDTIARSLAPLPPDNIAQLVGASLSLAMVTQADDEDDEDDEDEGDNDSDDDDEDDGPPICRPTAPAPGGGE